MPTWRPHLGIAPRLHAAGAFAFLALSLGHAPQASALVLPFKTGLRQATQACAEQTYLAPVARLTASTLESPAIAPMPQTRLAQLRAMQEGRQDPAPTSLVNLPRQLDSAPQALRLHCAGRLTAPPSAFVNRLPAESSAQPAVKPAGLILPPAKADRPVGFAMPAPIGDQPAVFGSVALPIARTSLDQQRRGVRFDATMPGRGPWSAMLRTAGTKSRLEAIDLANRWVNARVKFTSDSADRWASAEQTLLRGKGDCEDYAIAKMALLRSLGISNRNMYLVVVRDTAVRDDHMLLVVRQDDQLYALDSRSDRLLDATQPSDYRPIMSFSRNRAWFHGYATGGAAVSAR